MLFIDVIDGDKTKTINIPTDWEDMTLTYWCGIYRIFRKYREQGKLTEKLVKDKIESHLEHYTSEMNESNLDFLKERDAIKMNKDIFKYIAQVSDEDIERVDFKKAMDVLSAINIFQEEYKPKGIQSFEFEDEIYYFPKDNMKDNTFGDYIESTQLDMNEKAMTNGHYDVLPEQMAILCRRLGEEYDEDEVAKKTEKFKNLKMDIIMEFSFFFDQTKSSIGESFGNVFGGERRGGGSIKGKIASDGYYKKYIKPFGWLNSLFELAEKKIFTIKGMNEIDSVKNTNLYKVLTYLSWQNAKSDYEGAVQEAIYADK